MAKKKDIEIKDLNSLGIEPIIEEEPKKKKVKKKREVKKDPLLPKYKKGDIICVDFDKLPGTVLGKEYMLNDTKVRLVYIGEVSKLEVV